MSCWGCFAKVARDAERRHKENKEFRQSFRKRSGKNLNGYNTITCARLSDDEKQKMIEMLAKNNVFLEG